MAVVVLFVSNAVVAADPVVLTEEFDGEFDLKWARIRADAALESLTSHPGELAIKTAPGTIYKSAVGSWAPLAKNILLCDEPIALNQDFDATLHVSHFEPETHFQQIAMLYYQDDDQYLKWEFARRASGDPPTMLLCVVETNAKPNQPGHKSLAIDGPFWLRVSRRGDDYLLSHSDDGDEFTQYAKTKWVVDPKRKSPRIGFVAKNGSPIKDSVTITIESFELRLAPVK